MDMKLAYIMLSTTWVIKSDLNQTCALNLILTGEQGLLQDWGAIS